MDKQHHTTTQIEAIFAMYEYEEEEYNLGFVSGFWLWAEGMVDQTLEQIYDEDEELVTDIHEDFVVDMPDLTTEEVCNFLQKNRKELIKHILERQW